MPLTSLAWIQTSLVLLLLLCDTRSFWADFSFMDKSVLIWTQKDPQRQFSGIGEIKHQHRKLQIWATLKGREQPRRERARYVSELKW